MLTVVCFILDFLKKQCRHHNLKKGCSIVSQNGILVSIMGNMADFFIIISSTIIILPYFYYKTVRNGLLIKKKK